MIYQTLSLLKITMNVFCTVVQYDMQKGEISLVLYSMSLGATNYYSISPPVTPKEWMNEKRDTTTTYTQALLDKCSLCFFLCLSTVH